MEPWADLAAKLAFVWPYLPGFLRASWLAFQLAIVTIVVSWLCGLLVALARQSPRRPIRWSAQVYIWFIRGTPTLIQIFIIYFGLPQLGLRLSPFVAGVLALGIASGAYVAEIIRTGLNAIPKGQFDAARALGLGTADMLRFVILPQIVRVIVPALTNEAINTLKNTSLLSTITVVELTLHAQSMIAATFRPFEFYILAAFLYLAMTSVLAWFARWYERRHDLAR